MKCRYATPWFVLPITLGIALGTINTTAADLIQWINRVPAGESNPTDIGSYTNTIEIGNGGTTGYDTGLDIDLNTSTVPNERFFVTYIDHGTQRVEYEFTQDLQPGESYTVHLSFENNSSLGSAFTPNTIDFIAADGHFTYDLAIDTNDNGSNDTFRSGDVALGEIAPWNQLIFQGNDHRNGWHYGELTITNSIPEPTSFAYLGIAFALSVFAGSTRRPADISRPGDKLYKMQST